MPELAVAFLTLVAVFTVGLGCTLVLRSRRDAQLARARVVDDLTVTDDDTLAQVRFVGAIHRLGELVSKGEFSRNLVQHLGRAGYHSRNAPAIYMGTKILLLFGGGIGVGVLVIGAPITLLIKATAVLFTAGLASMLPNVVVGLRRRARSTQIQRYLPDAVDLLEICVSSGMGLDQAWNSVSDEVRRVSPVLSDEMELTNLEMQLGVARHEAMRNMSKRTGAEEISSLVALMVQSERFGASIVDALHTFAASMREGSSKKAEEAAEKMAVKMLAPMVLFIFPTLLIVMVGPAVMRITDVMT